MDYSLLNSSAYKDASSLFPEVDPYSQDIVKQTLSQGESAGLGAKTQTMQNLANQGFGRSTFGEQLGTVAQAKASKPYIESAINAANTIKQQRIQNMLNFLNSGMQYDKYQQELDAKRKQIESSNWLAGLTGLLPYATKVASFIPGMQWLAPVGDAALAGTLAKKD